MTINKALFLFTDQSYGWTESLYDPVDSPSLQDTLNKAIALAPVRQKMLAENLQIAGIRVSTIGVPRSSLGVVLGKNAKVSAWNGQSIKSLIGNIQLPADNPFSAVKVILAASVTQGATTYNLQSKRSISGVPDALVLDQDLDAGDPWFPAWQNYLARLVANWGILAYVRPVPNVQANLIKSIIQDTAGNPVITLTNALATLSASCTFQLRVYGYKSNPGGPTINGVFPAKPNNSVGGMADTWTLLHPFKPLDPLCLGAAAFNALQVAAIKGGSVVGPGKKARGRPSRLPRGRARKR